MADITYDNIIMGLNFHKIFTIAGGFAITAGMIYMALGHYSKNEMESFWACVTVIIVADVGLFLEYLIHQFKRLRIFRSFSLTIACHIASVYYACTILPTPGFLPGYFLYLKILEEFRYLCFQYFRV